MYGWDLRSVLNKASNSNMTSEGGKRTRYQMSTAVPIAFCIADLSVRTIRSAPPFDEGEYREKKPS